MVVEWLGCPVERNAKVVLVDGVHIELDLYSEKEKPMKQNMFKVV